jgi:SAM-dependent methyltransferase
MLGRVSRRAGRLLIAVRDATARVQANGLRSRLENRLRHRGIRKVNLCCGQQRVDGYFGIDMIEGADLRLDLSRVDLPFLESSLSVIVCMSAINYFTRVRAQQLVREIHRVLQQGGVCRVGVQDLKSLAERYVRGDQEFFFQKLIDGRERFEGPTIGDKFAAWLYGYSVGMSRCEYFYDFDSLAYLFRETGFSTIERKDFRESRIAEVEQLDNRADQMFFLEATK